MCVMVQFSQCGGRRDAFATGVFPVALVVWECCKADKQGKCNALHQEGEHTKGSIVSCGQGHPGVGPGALGSL